jgi:hypothetical protein
MKFYLIHLICIFSLSTQSFAQKREDVWLCMLKVSDIKEIKHKLFSTKYGDENYLIFQRNRFSDNLISNWQDPIADSIHRKIYSLENKYKFMLDSKECPQTSIGGAITRIEEITSQKNKMFVQIRTTSFCYKLSDDMYFRCRVWLKKKKGQWKIYKKRIKSCGRYD